MRSITKITTAALATAALVPAAALADISVDSLSLTPNSAHQATVAFETDAPLARGEGGIIKGSVRLAGGDRSNIRTSSHEDNRYVSTVKSDKRLVPGRLYTVRIKIAGQDPIVRKLRLR